MVSSFGSSAHGCQRLAPPGGHTNRDARESAPARKSCHPRRLLLGKPCSRQAPGVDERPTTEVNFRKNKGVLAKFRAESAPGAPAAAPQRAVICCDGEEERQLLHALHWMIVWCVPQSTRTGNALPLRASCQAGAGAHQADGTTVASGLRDASVPALLPKMGLHNVNLAHAALSVRVAAPGVHRAHVRDHN